jgi:hypothetical protein
VSAALIAKGHPRPLGAWSPADPQAHDPSANIMLSFMLPCHANIMFPQAISKLPQLTLLTSLTPTSDPLQCSRQSLPHRGLDLGMLLPVRSCLQGLDVAVMRTEHLANLGQFSLLQRLCIRWGLSLVCLLYCLYCLTCQSGLLCPARDHGTLLVHRSCLH